MALQAKVLTVDCPASTGTQAYTGVGFQPQALILAYTTLTGDGSAAHSEIGIGIASGPSNRFAWSMMSDDNVATMDTRRGLSDAHCVRFASNNAGTAGLEADLVSLDSDGFTLNWSIVTSGADIHVLALGGMGGAKAVGFSLTTGTGNLAVTGAGFLPVLALFLAITGTTGGIGAGSPLVNLSVTDGSAAASFAVSLSDGTGSANARMVLESSELLKLVSTIGSIDGTADFVSFDADGVTVNVTNGYALADLASVLLLTGINAKVGTITVPGSTGTQAVTGVGFEPDAVMFFGDHAALSSSASSTFAPFVGFASSPTARAVVSTAHVHASDPTVCDHDSDTTHAIKALTAGTPTVDYAADLDSLDADGFTLDWTTVGTGGGTDGVVYVAFGAIPVAASAARSQAVFVG